MTQSEISKMERRSDHRLSTLRRLVRALGGDLEVVANFGDKRVRLHGTETTAPSRRRRIVLRHPEDH